MTTPPPVPAEQKALRVRVAEALGWREIELDLRTWRGCSPTGPTRIYDIPPYGEDTPEGWACTGPLLARFELSVIPFGSTWDVFGPQYGPSGERQSAEGPHPCAAIAEWVAQFGAEVKS